MSSGTWKLALVLALALAPFSRRARAGDYYVMPYKTDPPIVVDGQLDDWQKVPNALQLDRKEQVTYGTQLWKGPEDLSGTIHLAWREEGIFIAAEVTDDVVQQPYTGKDIWMGDHVNLWLDMTPGVEPDRTMFGQGQYQVVLSPGNLLEGDRRIPPEIYIYRPQGLTPEGGKIAARKTDKGYLIEAYVPFACLGISGVAIGKDANFEVAISDSDTQPAKQEKLMTFGTRPWETTRTRMLPMVFGDGNGVGAPPSRTQPLLSEGKIKTKSDLAMKFTPEQVPAGKKAYLFFKARVQDAKVGGFVSGALSVSLNGTQLDGKRLSNRPMISTLMDGREFKLIRDDGVISAWFSPSFAAVDSDPNYAPVGGVKACEYEFDVSGLLKADGNEVVFHNISDPLPGVDRTVSVGGVELRFREPAAAAAAMKPAPTGEIPVIEPQVPPQAYSELKSSEGSITFQVNAKLYAVGSTFSTPDGKWAAASNTFFKHKREVIPHPEWIEVRDTFTNLTQENLPIMQAHRCALGSEMKGSWLAGVQIRSAVGHSASPENPSIFAATEKSGVGMVALNDEFRVHVNQDVAQGAITLADYSFVLKPGADYTAEWAIVPVSTPDFWSFINAARRMMDVNFPLKYCFAFAFHEEPVYKWSDETLRQFVETKGVNFLVQSNDLVQYNGTYARVTGWVKGPLTPHIDFQKRVRKLWPDRHVKTGIYFDCFLGVYEPDAEALAADRALDSSGRQFDYGGEWSMMKEYIPTLTNEWGRRVTRWADAILDTVGADGIYQDEFTYSTGPYCYNMWDGCTADISRTTGRIERLKGSVALLSRDFRAKLVERILARGCPYIINGAPFTRTIIKLKFEAFTETGSMTNCRGMILYSPIALGDHLTEVKYEDSYRNMLRALDHGCLYVWYPHIFNKNIAPTYYYYPFTPIELHGGYVIGQERIITKESGLFGWGDASAFDAHVFNRDGIETTDIKVPLVTRRDKHFAEVRLPEGYLAILVRK